MIRITKQSKKWVIGIALLVGALVISLILSLVYSGSATPWLMIVITLLAVGSGGQAISMRIRRGKYPALMDNQYDEAYESVMIALRNSGLGAIEQKDILLDIADLMLAAQRDGRVVGEVLGQDIGQFVNRTIEAYGYRHKLAFNLLYGLQCLVGSLVIVQAANCLLHGAAPFFETAVGVMILPYLVLLSFVLLPLMHHFIARQKLLWTILPPVLLVAAFFAINSLLHAYGEGLPWAQVYLDGEVVVIGAWWVLLILAIVFAGSFALKYWLRRRAIRSL